MDRHWECNISLCREICDGPEGAQKHANENLHSVNSYNMGIYPDVETLFLPRPSKGLAPKLRLNHIYRFNKTHCSFLERSDEKWLLTIYVDCVIMSAEGINYNMIDLNPQDKWRLISYTKKDVVFRKEV